MLLLHSTKSKDAPTRLCKVMSMLHHQVGSAGLNEGNKCHIISQKTAFFVFLAKYMGIYLAI